MLAKIRDIIEIADLKHFIDQYGDDERFSEAITTWEMELVKDIGKDWEEIKDNYWDFLNGDEYELEAILMMSDGNWLIEYDEAKDVFRLLDVE